MRIYRHLDWLSITIADQQNWRQFLPGRNWLEDGKGRHGYRAKWTDKETGITVETDSDAENMGSHFTMTGAPLDEARAIGLFTDDELANLIGQWGARVSRADLAIDVWGSAITPEALAKALTSKAAKIPAREWRLIEGHNKGIDGNTLDTGNPDSDRKFRLYDKSAEKRIRDGEAWVRLELELRRKYALGAMHSCMMNGTQASISGHIAAYLHWQNPDYSQVMNAESVAPTPSPRTETNRRKWLKGQVAVALAREVIRDRSFKAEFDLAFNYWLEKLDAHDTM